jgi:integrase
MTKLTTKKIEALLKVGRNARVLDGQGLLLQIRSVNRASWIMRYASPVTGRTRELGLGSWQNVGLAEARQKAAEARLLVSKGQDPIAAKQPVTVRKAAVMSFGDAAEAFFNAHQTRWRNDRVRKHWLPMLRRHLGKAFWETPVNDIDHTAVLAIVEPLWSSKNCTAKRVCHRVGQVCDYSRVKGWRAGDNPARFKGLLQYALPPRNANLNIKHHAAVPLPELPALMERLAALPGTAALAARLAILMASRPGEVFGMTWSEVDLSAKTWTIPGSRYKTGVEFTRPLSSAALEVLARCPRAAGNPFCFISPMKAGAPLSNMGVIALFKRMGVNTTLHGCARSLFSDHFHNETDHDHTMIELALGHSQNAIVKAYWRTSPLAKLRTIFEEWGDFCMAADTKAAVLPFKAAGQ